MGSLVLAPFVLIQLFQRCGQSSATAHGGATSRMHAHQFLPSQTQLQQGWSAATRRGEGQVEGDGGGDGGGRTLTHSGKKASSAGAAGGGGGGGGRGARTGGGGETALRQAPRKSSSSSSSSSKASRGVVAIIGLVQCVLLLSLFLH